MTGPAVVAIGGGHGLATTLRAVRQYAARVTAVVTTADDGGSSGRLRGAVDVPAPGDIRRCLVALADEGRWPDALDYRFPAGDVEGHAVGNLVLAALAQVTGDFVAACDEVARLLGIDTAVARVLPATTEPVLLRGHRPAGSDVDGQVAVAQAHVDRVELVPAPASPKQVVEAIVEADQVVLGPGSLYTSVLAAAVAPDVNSALRETGARVLYVCNLRAERGETQGYDVAAHVDALTRHGVAIDGVLVQRGSLPLGGVAVEVIEVDLARSNGLAHDPDRLAAALANLVVAR